MVFEKIVFIIKNVLFAKDKEINLEPKRFYFANVKKAFEDYSIALLDTKNTNIYSPSTVWSCPKAYVLF